MYKAILLSIGTPTTLGIYYEDMSQNKENLEEVVYTDKADNESTLENKAPKLIFILRIDGKTSDVLPLLFVSHNLDKKTAYTSLESLLTKEVLSKCSLAECLIDSSFLQENKGIKHILKTLSIKDSIDSMYSNQKDSIHNKQDKDSKNSQVTKEIIEPTINCHIERSEISNIKSTQSLSYKINSNKDISPFSKAQYDQKLDSCQNAPQSPAPTHLDKNLDSTITNHANKTTNSSNCYVALDGLWLNCDDRSYLGDNDYPSNSANRPNYIDKGANLENLDIKHNIYFNEKIDSKTQIDFIKINCNLSKALYLLSYFMPLSAIYYSRGVGSLSAIKLTHVFLHTLSLSSDIKIYATNSFYFAQTNEIKAFANMSFYLKPDSKHIVITDSNVKDYIHIAPSNINASNINDSLDLSTLFLPYRLIHNDFLESCTPLYVTPAV